MGAARNADGPAMNPANSSNRRRAGRRGATDAEAWQESLVTIAAVIGGGLIASWGSILIELRGKPSAVNASYATCRELSHGRSHYNILPVADVLRPFRP